MAIFGLTDEGLVIKTLNDLLEEIDADLRANIKENINLLPESLFAQIKNVMADRESNIWAGMEDVNAGHSPKTATAAALDDNVAIVGVTRLPATKSVAEGQALFGIETTVIPAGTLFSVEGNSEAIFETDEEKTLDAGQDEIQRITYDVVPTSGSYKLQYGDEESAEIDFDAIASEIQDIVNALSAVSEVSVTGDYTVGHTFTFEGEDGLQPHFSTGLNIIDNTLQEVGVVTLTFSVVQSGEYQAQVDCTALQTGPVSAPAKFLNVIDTPVSGLTKVFNPKDAAQGRNLETDAELRIRRNNSIVTSTASTLEAIRNKILELNEDVTKNAILEVIVHENVTFVTDSNGVPGKAMWAIVQQAGVLTDRDDEIAEAILLSKPVGIETHGDIITTVKDSMEIDHTIKFSRPDEVTIYIILDITTDVSYPLDGDTLIKDALVTHGTGLLMGQDVIVHPTLDAIIFNAVPSGIIDLVIKIGVAPAPTLDNNIIVTPQEITLWSAINIMVNQV